MGIFDDEIIISVASTVYNLAGDTANQPKFLRTLVMQNLFSGSKSSMGDIIRRGYLKGLGMRMRSFFRWSDINYTYLGLPTGKVENGSVVSPVLVEPYLPIDPGKTANVVDAFLEDAYFDRWVEQWFLENEPDLINDDDFTIGIHSTSDLITITWDGGRVETFYPTDYDAGAPYIFSHYYEITGPQYGPIITGSTVVLDELDSFPDITGWEVLSDVSSFPSVSLDRVETILREYSDARPDEEEEDTTSDTEAYTIRDREYRLDSTPTQDPMVTHVRLLVDRRLLYFYENAHIEHEITVIEDDPVEVEPGVFMTETTTIDQEILVIDRSYREDTQEIVQQEWSNLKLYIYRIGSGISELDDIVSIVADYGKFFPVIPLRIDNEMVSESYDATMYEQALRATKKVLGRNSYDEILSEIENHPDVGDIDYAYIAFGVSLNTTNKSSRRYLYDFFRKLKNNSIGTSNRFRMKKLTADLNYDIRVSWTNISETFETGLGMSGAKKGEAWLSLDGSDVVLYYQYDVNNYSYITVSGLVHDNYIYQGNRVTITGVEALSSTTESGFILPLHNGTFREMPLLHATQMANSCAYIVINAYTTQTIPWWQTGFWSWVIVIVIAIGVAVFTGGAGIGLLGANLAVGSAVGLTGVTAAIVGSVLNAIAALVLVNIITSVSTFVFGEEWGPIIGAIISMVVMNMAVNFHTGNGFNFNISDLMKAENILRLTDAAVKLYTNSVDASITDMQTQLQQLQEETNTELKRLQEAFFQEFGLGGGLINPLELVASSPVITESRDTFLTRTLMTGSDVASMSNEMLTDFAGLTLALPNAFT